MAIEPKHIPFEEFTANIQALFEEAERDGQPIIIERAGKSFTLRPPRPRRRKKTGIITPDDPMWELVGIISSGHSDMASNKHKYLAEAYAAHSDSEALRHANDDGDATDASNGADSKPTRMEEI